MPKFLVRVKMVDVLEKEFEAADLLDAKAYAEEEGWSPMNGWKQDLDLGTSEILDVKPID